MQLIFRKLVHDGHTSNYIAMQGTCKGTFACLSIILFCSILTTSSSAQKKYLVGANNIPIKQIVSKINIDKFAPDTFDFTNEWDYPDYTIEDDSGHFEIMEDRKIEAKDTAHLFYTAKCSTNVQGGYEIRYCYATKSKSKITLTFTDGFPAYASQFFVYINAPDFWCDAETLYPMINFNQKKSCRITQQKLIVDKSSYAVGDTISGFIDMHFIETVSVPKRGTHKSIFSSKDISK